MTLLPKLDLAPTAVRSTRLGQATDPSSLEREKSKSDIEGAAKKFEALMLHELMKSMRATVPRDDEDDSFGLQMADDMFDQTLADEGAGGIGLAPLLVREFSRDSVSSGINPMPRPPPRARTGLPPRLESSENHLPVSRLPGSRPRVGIYGYGSPAPGHDPVEGIVSSKYGWRNHPIDNQRRFHGGKDIAAPTGTEIHAVQPGTVIFAGRRGGYGKVVELQHSDGSTTRYAHASRIHVRMGDLVESGEAIADVGHSGAATGSHLHFEVRIDGKTTDPDRYLKRLRSGSKI